MTYTASALLHVSVTTLFSDCGDEQQSAAEDTFFSPQGLSFHLGAVLLSLGFITYVEHGRKSFLGLVTGTY